MASHEILHNYWLVRYCLTVQAGSEVCLGWTSGELPGVLCWKRGTLSNEPYAELQSVPGVLVCIDVCGGGCVSVCGCMWWRVC